jgi:hypothetical protein
MKERAEEDRDPMLTQQVDDCIAQWTRGLLQHYEQETSTTRNVLKMQSQGMDLVAQALAKIEQAQQSKNRGIDAISREKVCYVTPHKVVDCLSRLAGWQAGRLLNWLLSARCSSLSIGTHNRLPGRN